MKKTSLMALLLGCAASYHVAAERLVVTYDTVGTGQHVIAASIATPETCLPLTSGKPWCVPLPPQQYIQTQQLKQPLAYRSVSLQVPAELSLVEAKALLENIGLYRYVEHDIVIAPGATWNEITPDDTYFGEQQLYFADNSPDTSNASSILSMWGMLKAPEKNVHVYVLDVGFRLGTDIDYAPGYNFVTMVEGDVRGPGFLEEEFGDGSCPNNHGIGVAGVIGAKIHNGFGVTGTTGDVTIHPLRVMRCGNGVMSDAAAALDWLAGDSLENLPDFTGEPGIVNMSLGGKVGDTGCPFYLQNAIDKVTAKGFTIVASAGNQNEDAALYIPANCDNVITVGAANEGDAYNPADMAGFSNYGAHINVMAVGDSVVGLVRNDDIGYWSGTSFAAPIVAGIITNLSKDFDFIPAQWAMLVELSTVSNWIEGGRCDTLGCGAGILDAVKLYNNAQALSEGRLDSMSYLLSELSNCNQSWFTGTLLKSNAPCGWVLVDIKTLGELTEQEHLKLWSVEHGMANTAENRALHGEFTQNKFSISRDEAIGRDFYIQKCADTGDACGEFAKIDSRELENMPAVCQ